MKNLVLILLLAVPQFIMCTPESTEVKKEQKKLTKLQKYGLIGLGAAAVVGVAVFGGHKMYRDHCYQQANKPDEHGRLPLSKAIDDVSVYAIKHQESEKLEALNSIKKLISDGARINVIDCPRTHLTRAVCYRLTDVITILLDHGAEIDLPQSNGNTALWEAVFSGSEDTVKLLIDRGANPNLVGNYDKNALFMAIDFAQESRAEYILEHSKVKIDINARNEKGDTLLIAACRYGRVKTVEKLLAMGSDVDAHNDQQETALSVIERDDTDPRWNDDNSYTFIAELLSEARKKQSLN